MSKRGDKPSNRPPSLEEVLAAWEAERGLRTDSRTAVYVSTPITTGWAFVEWLRKEGRHLDRPSAGYERALRAEVILPNIQRAARFMELLRWRHVGLIIDTTSLEVSGWGQATYHQF